MNRKMGRLGAVLKFLACIGIVGASMSFFRLFAENPDYDLVITGAMVLTGDGGAPFLAEIGIRDGRIAAIGNLRVAEGVPILRARGRFVCPGFIDIHTHAETGLMHYPGAENYLLQGVTTVVGGNCGSSHFPISNLVKMLERQEIAVNFASFTGHNTIRAIVMGRKTATPTPRELRRMKAMIEQDLQAGSFGLSSGLTYFPGRHTTTKELIELAAVLAPYDGLYVTHMRSEGRNIALALAEAIHIGEKAGVRVQVSHLKLFDESVWGQTHLITDLLEYAQKRRVRITSDQYPYTASSTAFSAWFPRWSQPVLRSRSKTSASYVRLKNLLARSFEEGLSRFWVGTCRTYPAYEGKNFVELLEMLDREATPQNAAELLIEMQRRGNAQGIFFFMQEKDVESIMQLPENMIASDGVVAEFGEGKPHCRSYGTFPRVLARYVREKRILTLEEAVRKMTSLPAQTLRFEDRGLLKPGYWADLVVFDLAELQDTATYADPHQYPEGIAYVIVNGRVAAVDGRATGERAGRIITPR